MRDDTQSGQKMLMTPKDLEAVTSMMYNMSLQQGKTKKPFKPHIYQKRGRGQRQNYDSDRDSEIIIGKDKMLGKTGVEMIIEGMGICKISVEMMEEIEVGEILTEVIVVTGVGQEKESLLPRRFNNNNRQNGSPRFRSRSRSRSSSRITTNRDRTRCYRCQEYDHFMNECPNTITSDSDGCESDNAVLQVMATDIESGDMQDIDRYMEDTEYLNL